MPDENEGRRQWIVEPPPASGEVSLYVSGGEGVELTVEQEAALGALLRALELGDPEVAGFTGNCPNDLFCSPQSGCWGLSCGKVNCSLTCHPLNKKAAASSSPSSSWDLMGTFSPRAV